MPTYVASRQSGRRDWEHRQIAERVLGRPLPVGAEIHHVDGNGRNNAHRNLVICQDHAYHFLLERRQRIRALGGDPNTQEWCSFCKALRPVEAFWLRKSGPAKGRRTPYCRLCRKQRHDIRRARLAACPDRVSETVEMVETEAF